MPEQRFAMTTVNVSVIKRGVRPRNGGGHGLLVPYARCGGLLEPVERPSNRPIFGHNVWLSHAANRNAIVLLEQRCLPIPVLVEIAY